MKLRPARIPQLAWCPGCRRRAAGAALEAPAAASVSAAVPEVLNGSTPRGLAESAARGRAVSRLAMACSSRQRRCRCGQRPSGPGPGARRSWMSPHARGSWSAAADTLHARPAGRVHGRQPRYISPPWLLGLIGATAGRPLPVCPHAVLKAQPERLCRSGSPWGHRSRRLGRPAQYGREGWAPWCPPTRYRLPACVVVAWRLYHRTPMTGLRAPCCPPDRIQFPKTLTSDRRALSPCRPHTRFAAREPSSTSSVRARPAHVVPRRTWTRPGHGCAGRNRKPGRTPGRSSRRHWRAGQSTAVPGRSGRRCVHRIAAWREAGQPRTVTARHAAPRTQDPSCLPWHAGRRRVLNGSTPANRTPPVRAGHRMTLFPAHRARARRVTRPSLGSEVRLSRKRSPEAGQPGKGPKWTSRRLRRRA
jgi:hypothetical protein